MHFVNFSDTSTASVSSERKMEQKYSTVNGEIAIDFPGDGNYNQTPLHSSTFDQVQRSTFAIENQQPNEQVSHLYSHNLKLYSSFFISIFVICYLLQLFTRNLKWCRCTFVRRKCATFSKLSIFAHQELVLIETRVV